MQQKILESNPFFYIKKITCHKIHFKRKRSLNSKYGNALFIFNKNVSEIIFDEQTNKITWRILYIKK
jgi:hypothetical protein